MNSLLRRAVPLLLALAPALPGVSHEGFPPTGVPFLSGGGHPAVAPTRSDRQLAPAQFRRDGLPLEPGRQFRFTVDSGTWISPDISPCGDQLVFDLLGDLYLMPARGGRARALTRGLAVDAQPVFAPDCRRIAFVSDRSGAENLWVLSLEDQSLQAVTRYDNNRVLVSPAWSADGDAIFASRYLAELTAYELWRFPLAAGASPELLSPARTAEGAVRSALGAAPSADGRYLYYAAREGRLDLDGMPEWRILRRDLGTGEDSTLVRAPPSPRPDLVMGTAFRPRISPDGRWLVYGARREGRTGLRRMDLRSGADDWLVFPVQRDQAQSSHWRDILPGHAFTPDGNELAFTRDGRLFRLDLATMEEQPIPFSAEVALDLGPDLRVPVPQETGPVHARVIQHPAVSPSGSEVLYTAFGYLYRKSLAGKGSASPERLTRGEVPEFHPTWSADGERLAYVTWAAEGGGQVWLLDAAGAGGPTPLAAEGAFYSNPVFTPDGRALLVLRSSSERRMMGYMEYGGLRQAELLEISLDSGASRVVYRGELGGPLHFAGNPGRVLLREAQGLRAIDLATGEARPGLSVTGAGWYFAEGEAPVDGLRMSPDGTLALAQAAQQLHLVTVPRRPAQAVSLLEAGPSHRQITRVGADFFSWSADGKSLYWAVGSSLYHLPLAALDEGGAGESPEALAARFDLDVARPRDVPRGDLVLRGATAITMEGDRVVADSDIVIRDDRIVYVGRRGGHPLPEDAEVMDLGGAFVVPGFIDAHDHIADIRRDLLDLEGWGFGARLAYGVTTAFDPSPLSIDMLVYEDLVDTGQVLGPRIHSTGPALFSFNNFTSRDQVRDVLRRYREHYRVRNLKVYRSGNRRVRQWIAQEASAQGMLPTTEGALAMKLDLSQVLDGFPGHEHAFPVVPLGEDMLQLLGRSGVAYTPTLQIANGGPGAQDYYIVRDQPLGDEKLNRFVPRRIANIKFRQRTWRTLDDYLFPQLAEDIDRLDRAGGLVSLGTHGEVPGLGVHWEMEAYVAGGMPPLRALRAATLGAARAIGRDAEFGSLEVGKYADLVVLDRNPLEVISNTRSIRYVMKGGRLYRGEDLRPVWPRGNAYRSPPGSAP